MSIAYAIAYAIVKDPFVCYKTVAVLRSQDKPNESLRTGGCEICNKNVHFEPLNLFARKLIDLFCSFDCLKKFDNGYLDKRVDVRSISVSEKEEEIDWRDELDGVLKPIYLKQTQTETEPVKATKVVTGVKKTCPKCGGAAKRGRGAGRFHHDPKCTEATNENQG